MSKILTAVSRGTGDRHKRDDADRSWTVEMSIPIADLAPETTLGKPSAEARPGAVWGINFYRVERSGAADAELQAWGPVKGDFHAVQFYGRAVFE